MRRRMEWLNEKLPFPLRTVQTELGPLEVYEIPGDQKLAVIKVLYPFCPLPGLKDAMEDIPAGKTFKVKEFIVTREAGMNVLVSPYFLERGGTVIDWIPVYEDESELEHQA